MAEAEEPSSAPRQGRSRGPLVAAAVMVTLASVLWFTGRRQAAQVQYKRSRAVYVVPDVTLVDQNGALVRLGDVLGQDRPVLLNFIYTSCTTLSPVLSAGFASLQRQLGPGAADVRLVSITIDPATDAPPRLKEYLTRYRAQRGWYFLTGSRKNLDTTMRAFDAYMGTVESHYAVTFLRAARATEWERLQGLVNPSDLLREYRSLGAPKPPSGK